MQLATVSRLSLKFDALFSDNHFVDELTREFLIESQEGLDRMERALTDLEERPQDTDLLAEIFRAVHTIKGTTGFLGFARLESLAHAGENLLGLLRDGKLHADADIISGLLALMDGLRAILRAIEETASEGGGDDRALIERLGMLQTPAPSPQVLARKILTRTGRAKAVSRRKRAPRPAVEKAPAEPVVVEEPGKPQPAESPAATAGSGAPADSKVDPARSRTASFGDSTLRVDVTLLNRMMNLVGELVLTRNQILQATSADAGLNVLSRRLDMVTADLREAVMKARMQPVSHVFSKFPRMVRDLQQSLGKRVRLEMEGQETELDKSLLEAIKDPLTHAVRNALDHGIEAPDARLAAGKEPEGLLRLRAFQEGSHVIVEVTDDGAGMSVVRIRAKALERKLITAEKAALLDERELLQLIFLPGFSTAESVTNVSGRGVGMDVVRTNVEKIGGKVEIESRVGKGSTLRLRIPLTLAIIPALIVRSRQQCFALPQGALFELVHLSAEQQRTSIEWIEGVPLYRLRGNLLPLVFLDRLLAQPDAGGEHDASLYIAVLNAEGRRFGLIVDGLADPEEIVVKPLSPVLKQIGLFSGATVLGNGELALILDPGAIATRVGVHQHNEEEDESELVEQSAQGGAEYLLVETDHGRAAVPLADVLRIQRIPCSQVEYLGTTRVLRVEDAVLPLADASGRLSGAPDAEAQMTVVVCRNGGRHVGIAVEQVLDVAAGRALVAAGTDAPAAGVTLLKDRVTGIVDVRQIPALPAWASSLGESAPEGFVLESPPAQQPDPEPVPVEALP